MPQGVLGGNELIARELLKTAAWFGAPYHGILTPPVKLNTSPLLPIRKLLLIADALVVAGALAAAVGERVYLATLLELRGIPPIRFHLPEYILLGVLAWPLWLALAWTLELHTLFERSWTFRELFVRLFQHHLLGFVVVSTLVYATQVVVNRSLVLLFVANSFVAMLLLRWVVTGWRHIQYRRGLGRTRLLLVGHPTGALEKFAKDASESDFPPRLVGYLSPEASPESRQKDETGALKRLGKLAELDAVLHDTPADQVLFFPPCDRAERVESALLTCETIGVPALLWIDMETPTSARAQLTTVQAHPFVKFELAPKRVELLALKHFFDFLVAAVGLVLVSPILIGAAVAILVTDGRPVFFSQERAGYRGRPFRMLKFRTMVRNADALKKELMGKNEAGGPVFKITEDPRVTRLGRLLRKTSIDELPQLLHVLSGRMSLVGPRPLPLAEQRGIQGWHRRRLSMRPGISGLWQVSGRSDVGFERWMQFDLKYVDEWSPWLDMKILAKTIPVVLLQKGAR